MSEQALDSLRVAIVGNFALRGKQTMAERALPIAEALSASGHRVLLALPIRQDGDDRVSPPRGGVSVRYAGWGPRVPVLAHAWQTLHLFALARSWRPDVVYCFKPIAFSGAVMGLFWILRRLGAFHGALLLDTDDWEGDGGWNERQPFPGWLKRLIAVQERWSLRHADAVTVASRALEEMVARVGASSVFYLPNAVRPETAAAPAATGEALRARLGLGTRPVLLLYTRFVEFHVERVLDTLEQIAARVDNAILLVVGIGLAGEEVQLQNLAAERGLSQHLLLAGWLPPEDLPEYFASADVALYPMDDTLLNRTKCPAKLRDLLAAGVPVIADRVGQSAEYVIDGTTGLLVAPGDVTAMAAAAAQLMGDAERRRGLSEAARADVRARWTWTAWLPVLERALGAALSASQARPATERG